MKELVARVVDEIKALYEKAVNKAQLFIDIYSDMLADFRENHTKSSARPLALASCVGYFLLVFVVIYGVGHHVYDGFGSLAPWLIGTVFLVMSVIRALQFAKSYSEFAKLRQEQKTRRK